MASLTRKELKQLKLKDKEDKRDAFAASCYDKFLQYESDVLGEKITVNKWIYKAVIREQQIREQYHWDKEAVLRVFRFFYFIYLTVGGELRRFDPLPYQCWITACMYGPHRKTNTKKRLRRYALLWVARKNGKTAFAAILGLYALLLEERSAEVYFGANTKDQASQGLKYLQQIIDDSPALDKRIDNLTYFLRHRSKKQGMCLLKPVAADAKKLDGKRVTFALVDESHEMATKAMFQIMVSGTKNSFNPMIMQASTAGYHMDYPFYEDLEIGKKVLNGDVTADNIFYALYSLDSEDEIEQPDKWIKANPSIGVLLDEEDMYNDYQTACLTFTDRINYIVKNLNVFVKSGANSYIPQDKLIAIAKKVEPVQKVPCYMGLDLSKNRDITALSVCFETDSGAPHLICEAHFPDVGNGDKKIRAGGIKLDPWIEAKHITPHPQEVIDYDLIYERIEYYYNNYELRSIVYDAAMSYQLINRIKANLPYVDLVPMPQTAMAFSPVLKTLERFVYQKDVSIEQNPVILWQFENIVLYRDTNDNIKIMKNKGLDSVDVPVAMAQAFAGWMSWNLDEYSLFDKSDNETNN